jgi:flagellar biogenesis protein FliO
VNPAGDAALLARVTLSLIAVLVLAVLGARLARRMGLRAQGRSLRVVERLPLSREAFLAVVAVADRGLVLGVSPHGVRVLTELDGEALARAYPEPEPAPIGAGQPPGVRLGGRLDGRVGSRLGGRVGSRLGGRVGSRLNGQGRRLTGPGQRPGGRPATRVGGRPDDVAGVEVGADGVKVTRLHGDAAPAPYRRGTGSVLDPRTWRQAIETVRDLTVRRG